MSTDVPASRLPHESVSGEALHDILPNYEVLDLIGRGGMGVVYKARQVSLDRIVAIKLLPREVIRDDLDFKQRFRQEAQTMAKLSHPGIVAVHDFGETEDGQLFFVMEFIDGQDLAKVIEQRGALPLEESLRIFRSVAEALAYAHAEGVVHRDIKPANVLIKANGEVKVADFGLAKIIAPGTVGLTATSTSMGSHDFAAPEVFVHGGDADHRADVYSLGVMLYQMLTGVIPRGMFKLPSERVAELGTRFDDVICTALEQDCEDRFQSVLEMLGVMELLEFGEDRCRRQSTLARGPFSLRRRVVLGVAASVLIAGGGMLWDYSASPSRDASMPLKGGDMEWQNVLTQIDLAKHRRAGRWQKVLGGLENTDPVAGGVLEFPVTATGASDLRLDLRRLTTSSSRLSIAFHLGAHAGQFSISDYLHPSAGLEYIEGKSITDNGTAVEHVAAYLSIGHPHELLLQLREEGMTASLDGREIYRWKGDWARVSQGETKVSEALRDRNSFACYVGNGRLRIEAIAFREVTGEEGKELPPEQANQPRTPPLPEPQIFAGNGHRYQFVPGAFNWNEADANARSLGGHLATLTSAEENHWVWTQFSPYMPSMDKRALPERGWWIGGLTTEEDGWQWVSGEPFEYANWSSAPTPTARVPRLRQHNNGGGEGLSAWSPVHYSTRCGYVVEWDQSEPAPGSDAEMRSFAAWLFSLPTYSEPSHAEHLMPDLLTYDSNRNFRRLSDLPRGPFTIMRVRTGPLHMDDTARMHLEMMTRQTKLYDLRIYGADSAEVFAYLHELTKLGTLVIKADAGANAKLSDDDLANLAPLVNLNTLRLDGWPGFTGKGLSHMGAKRKLSSLSINDCADFNAEGLQAVIAFKNLEKLSLAGARKLTDEGLKALAPLVNLKSLGLGGTGVTEKGLDELRQLLPGCVINR